MTLMVEPLHVSKSLGRPRDVNSAQTRHDLLEVARRIFARDGYAATTNRSIAEEVGITTGAIYHYFPSKADLFAAVYEQVQCMVYDRFEVAAAGQGTLTERFGRVLETAVELNRSDSSLAGFVMTVPMEVRRHPELAESVAPQQHRSATFVAGLVADAVASDEFHDGVEPQAVADIIAVVFSGLATFSTVNGDPDRHAAAARALRRFLDGALVRRSAPRVG